MYVLRLAPKNQSVFIFIRFQQSSTHFLSTPQSRLFIYRCVFSFSATCFLAFFARNIAGSVWVYICILARCLCLWIRECLCECVFSACVCTNICEFVCMYYTLSMDVWHKETRMHVRTTPNRLCICMHVCKDLLSYVTYACLEACGNVPVHTHTHTHTHHTHTHTHILCIHTYTYIQTRYQDDDAQLVHAACCLRTSWCCCELAEHHRNLHAS